MVAVRRALILPTPRWCCCLALAVIIVPVVGRAASPDTDAIARYEQTRPGNLPSDALLALTRAYRDRQRFDRAEALAREGARRFPGQPVWPILLALILTDEGRPEESLAILATPAARRASELERELAAGYASRRAQRPFEALRHYATAAQRDPANREARDAVQAVLRDMRGPWGASRFASSPPPLPLASEMGAAEIRWGEAVRPVDPRLRFAGTDRALDTLDRLVAQDPNNTTLRFDRIVALHDRVRMADVVAEADALRRKGVALPDYVRAALADALLYLRQPRAALTEYQAVLATQPDDAAALAGKFYALVELEDFSEAYALADARLAAEPPWRRYAGDPTRYPREAYLDALLRAAAVRFYGDQPEQAWQRLAPARDAAPANLSVRLTAAAVMNAMGWLREAEQENRIALSLAPDSMAAQIAVADIALARGEYAEAEARIAELAAMYPENQQVQRLQRDLAARTGWRLDAEVRPAHEYGGGANGEGHELTTSATIASPLIDNRWRLFVSDGFADARPPEGYVARQRVEGGLQLSLPDLSASVSVHQDMGTLERLGATASADWQPSDQLRLAATAERISADTPLRALLHGITADSVNARATWAWDAGQSVSIGGGWMPFSDGNQRAIADARYSQKILSLPHLLLTGSAELYTSSNTRADASYYNPRADGSATIGLAVQHMLWRQYDYSLTEVVTLVGGMYGEHSYRGGPIGSVSYEHRWRFDPWTELVYGVSLSEHMYDGDPAHTVAAFVALHQRL